MSAPIVESSATAQSASTSSASVTVGKPTGTVAGDVLVAWIASDDNPTISAPGGWTQIVQQASSIYAAGAAFYLVAGGSEPASYTFDTSNGQGIVGGIVRISGADTATVVDVSAISVHTGVATTSTAPSVTTTVADCLILRFCFVDGGYSTGSNPATGIWTVEGPVGTGWCGNMAAYATQAGAGATGTASFSHRSEQGGAATVAIAPAVVTAQEIWVTAAGAYVEVAPVAEVRVTAAGAYVEGGTQPVAPSDLRAIPYSSAAIFLSLTDNSDDEWGFRWEWSSDGETWFVLANTDANVTVARHSGLAANTTYYYRAQALGGVRSNYTAVVAATTLPQVLPAGLRLWVEVEDASGNRLGPGPLTEIVSFRHTARLDRAGEIEFELPLRDGRAHVVQGDGLPLLAPKRYVRLYGVQNGAIALLCRGIVEEVRRGRSAGGSDVLGVRGADLLRELVRPTVSLVDLGNTPPTSTLRLTGVTAAEFLVTSYATAALLPGDWSFSGDDLVLLFDGAFLHVPLLEALGRVAEFTGEHFRLGTDREIEWLGPGTALAASGVRAVADVPSAGSGIEAGLCVITGIEEMDDAWDLVTRLYLFGGNHLGAPFQPFDFTQFPHDGSTFKVPLASIGGDGATVTVTTAIDHNWTTGTQILIAFTTNFDLISYKSITVTGADTFTYADTVTGTNTGEGYARVAASFTDADGDGWDVSSMGANGYFLHYLANTTQETASGKHQTSRQFAQIVPASDELADRVDAANMLMRAGYAWLRQRDEAQQFYRLSVTGLGQALLPGDTLRLSVHNWRDGEKYFDIEGEFVVLEAVTAFDAGGMRTSDLTVASTDRWPETDADVLVRQLQASLGEGGGYPSMDGKADKVDGATAGNLAGLDATGNLTDSGSTAADFAGVAHSHSLDDLSDVELTPFYRVSLDLRAGSRNGYWQIRHRGAGYLNVFVAWSVDALWVDHIDLEISYNGVSLHTEELTTSGSKYINLGLSGQSLTAGTWYEIEIDANSKDGSDVQVDTWGDSYADVRRLFEGTSAS